ncbi:hypothetical protein WA026_019813 [Henosepilachna vigintioctopunctata]|uniref:Uncharacterized protein n=1 Tax=Henosepilachna vigintioctopunctata TaxID=420089 RepID=A0AAW1VCC6_9CUCU
MNALVFLCNLIVFVIAPGPKTDYCFINCLGPYNVHLICQIFHRCPKPKKNCVQYQADQSWRRTVLDVINDARNAAANGSNQFEIGSTGSKNMNAVSYDMELEFLISCTSTTCVIPDDLEGCMDSTRFPVWWTGFSYKPKKSFGLDFWKSIIYAAEFHHGGIEYNAQRDEGVKYAPKFHHWSTIYFWRAKYVGCTAILGPNWSHMLCAFGPVYMKTGDIVYKVAKSRNEIASECEEGRNTRYPALCGNIDEVPTGEMWTHFNITTNSSQNRVFPYDSCNIILVLIIFWCLLEIYK